MKATNRAIIFRVTQSEFEDIQFILKGCQSAIEFRTEIQEETGCSEDKANRATDQFIEENLQDGIRFEII